jgi:hypothetical protein
MVSPVTEKPSYWERPATGPDVDKTMPLWKVPSEMGNQFEQSTFNLAKDIGSMFIHPIKTGKGIKDLATGIYHKFTEGVQPDEEQVDKLVGFFKDRYGGDSIGEVYENIKWTLAKDPAGVVDDVAMFLTGGAGAVAKVAKVAGKSGSKVAKIASTAVKVGEGLDISSKPFKAVGKGIGKLKDIAAPKNPGVSFYTKLAPHLKAKGDVPAADAIYKYFVDNGLQINRKTIAQMNEAIASSGKVIDDLVTESTKRGGEIPTEKVAKIYHDMIMDKGKFKLEGHDAGKNREFLLEGREAFMKEHGDTMTTRDLQDLKTSIGPKYRAALGEEMGKAKEKVQQGLYLNAKTALDDMFKGTEYASANKKYAMSKEVKSAINDTILELENSGGWMKRGLVQGGLGKLASTSLMATLGFAHSGGIGAGVAFVGSLGVMAILGDTKVQARIINRIAKNGKMRKSLAAKVWKKQLDKFKADLHTQYKNLALQVTKAEKREKERK